LNLHSASAIP